MIAVHNGILTVTVLCDIPRFALLFGNFNIDSNNGVLAIIGLCDMPRLTWLLGNWGQLEFIQLGKTHKSLPGEHEK